MRANGLGAGWSRFRLLGHPIRVQMTIQRGPVHPFNLRNLAHGSVALGHELGGPFQFRPPERRFPAPFSPSYPGGLQSCLNPFPYQVPLELGQGSKEREDELAGGRGGVDVFLLRGPRSCRLVIKATSSWRLRRRGGGRGC